jgi:hypothetical protein
MKLLVAVALCAVAAFAQTPAKSRNAPDIPFQSVPNFLKFPPNIHMGEGIGVATNSKGHIFVYTRSQATRLFEFDARGNYLRELGEGLYGLVFAHAVRVDPDDNIWVVDEGSNMVIKFNPAGRVVMVLGHRPEAVEGIPPAKNPDPYLFDRPTDVAWDKAGNIFVADGYNNSRVVKVDKNGRWVKTWGERGTGPSQFNILHSIASDANGNIYVADRTNRRIQVFDPEGTFLREFTIDVPFTKPPNVMLGAMPGPESNPLSVSGAPWAICITPGPRQFLYSSDAVPGRIYKLTLDGKVVGVLGEAGKELKQFGWIHEIACPSENELYVAELLNWRVQKLTLHPE